MLATSTVIPFALVLASQPATRQDTLSAVRKDSVIEWRDSTISLARRTSARVGIGSEVRDVGTSQASSDTTTTQRRRAVEHSDWYYRRLTIHKVASYTTLPLFVTEYILGDKLYKGEGTSTTKSVHGAVASGIGVLFGVNTVTGLWNLWDTRTEPEGRARRTTHALLMLASDAGFVATAALAPEGDEFGEGESSNNRSTHRNVAIGSMGVSLVSYLMMYLWK